MFHSIQNCIFESFENLNSKRFLTIHCLHLMQKFGYVAMKNFEIVDKK